MPTSSSDPRPTREELRQRFLTQAAAAFDLLFDPQHQEQLITFQQREERACQLGRDLTAWMLQQHLNADPHAQPDATYTPSCPKCHRPGRRVTPEGDPLPRRPVTTLAGEVTLQRQKWRCTTCRVVFFPPGSAAAAGDGGV
jgi:hypothetical protein